MTVRRPRQGDVAWAVLLAAVLAYELTADDLLSDATQRYCRAHPILGRVLIGALAGHLAGVLPPIVDVLSAQNAVHRTAVAHFPLARDRGVKLR